MDIKAPNPYKEYQCMPLHSVKCNGFTKLMKMVLLTKRYPRLELMIPTYIKENPEELDEKNALGFTPLLLSCLFFRKTTINTIKILIDAGANIEQELNFRQTMQGADDASLSLRQMINGTPLFLSCLFSSSCSHHSVVRLLIESGANVYYENSIGQTPLWAAALIKNNTIFSSKETLLEFLPFIDDINRYNKYGETVLYKAIKYSVSLESIKILLDSGSIIHSDTHNVLKCALQLKDPRFDIAELLLERGAVMNYDMLLNVAIKNDDSKILFFLINKGMDINYIYDSKTPLFRAVLGRKVSLVYFLINNGANLDFLHPDGYTALLLAVKIKHIEIIKLLLNAGADLRAGHILPLSVACRYILPQSIEIVDLLIHNYKCKGMSIEIDALKLACNNINIQNDPDMKIVEILLDAGCVPDLITLSTWNLNNKAVIAKISNSIVDWTIRNYIRKSIFPYVLRSITHNNNYINFRFAPDRIGYKILQYRFMLRTQTSEEVYTKIDPIVLDYLDIKSSSEMEKIFDYLETCGLQ